MASDKIRLDAYLAALARTVTKGSVVVDLGSGPGLFALHACRLGARRVYAIEPGETIEIARDLAASNGFADKIEFIQELSTGITLPERADVIVADLRGILPFYGASVASMIDARERFLARGGALIPQSDDLFGVLLEAPETYQRSVLAWDAALQGFDSSSIRRMTANSVYKIRTSAAEYLAEPVQIGRVDYRSVSTPVFRGEGAWSASRTGLAHGLGVWFDTELVNGIGFSNAPGLPDVLYGVAFFPFIEPVAVHAGDEVHASIHADPVGTDYVWRWTLVLNGKAKFEQSTFYGTPVSSSVLQEVSSV